MADNTTDNSSNHADQPAENPAENYDNDRAIARGTKDRIAKYALGLDAAFSTICGLVLMLGGLFMADTVGVSGWLLPVLGFGLLGWANMVTLYAGRRFVRRPELDRVIGGNLAWVVFAIVLVLIPGSLTSTGKWALVAVTAIVALFALVQISTRSSLVPAADDSTSGPAASESST